GLAEADPEPVHERGVADPEHRDVGGEPRPEQVTRLRGPHLWRDDLDTGDLDTGVLLDGRARLGCGRRVCHGGSVAQPARVGECSHRASLTLIVVMPKL